MDLMSGVVTAAAQIGVGFSLASPKVQNKIWNKLFKNCKFEDIGAAKKGFIKFWHLSVQPFLQRAF